MPAENRLFVTLDPRTRQLSLPGGETVLVTDTVGFVRKLPHELVEAFRSTLDSVRLADLIVHVVDGTAANAEAQMAAVREVLGEIGAADVPELVVVNKADRAPEEAKALAHANEGAVLDLGPHRRGGRRPPAGRSATGCGARTGWCSSSCPGRAATCWPPSTARARWWARATARRRPRSQVVLDDVGRARFAEFVAAP